MDVLRVTKEYANIKLILCGGGSGEQDYYANQKLNEIIDHDKPLLYIPLAMDESVYSYDSCYKWIKNELSQVSIAGIEMVRSFKDLAEKDFNDYSALFIGGGNTYKLLKGLKDNGIFSKIREYLNSGGVIIGSSAGAVIFGYDINIVFPMDSNDVNLKDKKGFNILDGISIFPHYTNSKSELSEDENEERFRSFTDSIINYSNTVGDVIAIPEEDAIFIHDGKVEILGSRPYYFFKKGESQKINISKISL